MSPSDPLGRGRRKPWVWAHRACSVSPSTQQESLMPPGGHLNAGQSEAVLPQGLHAGYERLGTGAPWTFSESSSHRSDTARRFGRPSSGWGSSNRDWVQGPPSTHPSVSDLESEPPLPAPSLPAPLTGCSLGNHVQSRLGISFQEPMVQGTDGAFSSFWDRPPAWDSAHSRGTARSS